MKEIDLYKMFVVEEVKPISEAYVKKLIESGYGFTITGELSPVELLKLNDYMREKVLSKTALSKTLFTRLEWSNSTQLERIVKQLVHYISFGTYGVQEIDLGNRKISYNIIKVVTKEELKKAIEEDIYSDKPLSVAKLCGILEMEKKYNFEFDIASIKNRELKAALVARSPKKVPNLSGDDILRVLIFLATTMRGGTSNALLIKSPEVKASLKSYATDYAEKVINILEVYKEELAKVFNRHKDLILSLKTIKTNRIVNRISKLSKKLHVPIKADIKKNLISYFNSSVFHKAELYNVLNSLKVTEKFNLLNLLAVKRMEAESRTFFIRNGKIWTKEQARKYTDTDRLINKAILETLDEDLKHLAGKVIKMPLLVEYGLPVSEKQSVGNVPFGTVIRRQDDNKVLTAGMYWRNEWGSRDLDLSSVDLNGNRVGWGFARTYSDGIIFSGDVTDAPNGAIECIGNPTDAPVILINNIFDGKEESRFKIVIGEYNKDEINEDSMFIEDALFTFDYQFQGSKKSCILGALTKSKFIVYPANLGSLRVSRKGDKSALEHIIAQRYSLRDILVNVGATVVTEGECDIDLSLEKITFQDLVKLVERN